MSRRHALMAGALALAAALIYGFSHASPQPSDCVTTAPAGQQPAADVKAAAAIVSAVPPPAASPAPGTAAGPQYLRVPLIGEDAPAFKADSTRGAIDFPGDFKGKWVILFSHPSDFTPVCTTEFMTFGKMAPQFKKLNCELLGLSIDGTYSHIAWLRTIRDKISYRDMKNIDITFPLISDLKMEVAAKYGMVQPGASDTKAVRAVFVIDPKAKIRAIIYYPMSTGRNFQELKRLLVAMQTSDTHACATPADWQPGDDVIVAPPSSCQAADDRVANPPEGTTVVDWFLTFKKLPKEKIQLAD